MRKKEQPVEMNTRLSVSSEVLSDKINEAYEDGSQAFSIIKGYALAAATSEGNAEAVDDGIQEKSNGICGYCKTAVYYCR